MSHISFQIKKKIKKKMKKINKEKNQIYFKEMNENNSKINEINLQIIYNKKYDFKVFLIILGLVIILGFSLKFFYNLF